MRNATKSFNSIILSYSRIVFTGSNISKLSKSNTRKVDLTELITPIDSSGEVNELWLNFVKDIPPCNSES